jgi:16S rRNA (cytosine1402-N4)-methyltransferase
LAGHSGKILEIIGKSGHLYGFEIEPRVAREAEKRLEEYAGSFTIFRANFRHFDEFLGEAGVREIDAAFWDLGVGWFHYGEGFGQSIAKDLPIDFRLSTSEDIPTGAEIIERANEAALAKIIFSSGERRLARRVARAIVENRPVRTSGNLARIIEKAVPRRFHRPGVSPAQRIFARIRVIVNDEEAALDEALSKLHHWLRPGGRVVILAYSSDEFAQVRKYMKGTGCVCPEGAPECVCGKAYKYRIFTDGERPGDQETERNPSARSARLSAAELLQRP